MRKKGKNGVTSTIVSATAVDVSNDDDVTRNNGNCDLCCTKISDGKEEAVQCEGVCGLWFHRYCAGISATHFQTLSTTNAPFVCSTCYQHDQHVLTAQLQSEVVTIKAEIIKYNELISSVPVSNVCVSTDNQSNSGTEIRSHVRNKKSDRSPVTKEQVSKHRTTHNTIKNKIVHLTKIEAKALHVKRKFKTSCTGQHDGGLCCIEKKIL